MAEKSAFSACACFHVHGNLPTRQPPENLSRPDSSPSEANATTLALPLEVDPGDPPLPRDFVLALTRFVVRFTQ